MAKDVCPDSESIIEEVEKTIIKLVLKSSLLMCLIGKSIFIQAHSTSTMRLSYRIINRDEFFADTDNLPRCVCFYKRDGEVPNPFYNLLFLTQHRALFN